MLAASPLAAQSAAQSTSAPAQKKTVVRVNRKTGKLVSSVVNLNNPAPAATPGVDVSTIVEEAARANDVDPLLVHAVIQVESNYNPYAVSSKGAQGLMQLMPPTAHGLGVSNAFDARQNIEAGVRYLKQLQDLYHDDRLALAAYNAGPGAVQKYKSIPPYPETQQYVKRVGERYQQAKAAAGEVTPAASNEVQAGDASENAAVVSTEKKQPRLERFLDENGRLHLRTAPE